MKNLVYRLLPSLAVVAGLGGCGTLERHPAPDFPMVIAKPAGAGAVASPDVRPPVGNVGNEASPREAPPPDLGVRLNLHVFGLSYHTDREGSRVSHLDNEVNAGLGLNYELRNDARSVTSLEAGFFRDSGREWAKFAGASYQLKFGERWLVGADLLALHSPTYNHGRAFVAPLPHLTYDFGAVKVNGTYIPKFQEFNRYAVFAVYLTIPLKKW